MAKKNNRHIALLTGELYYFSNKPCKRGHTTKRYTKTGSCIECRQITEQQRSSTYYQNNKEKILEKNKRSRQRRLSADLEAKRAYYLANKSTILEYQKHYRETNRDKDRSWKKAYKERKAKRTPPWLTDDQMAEIREFYTQADRLTKTTGILHHVDHIVPLRGKIVSGLHVPWNLQILTFIENRTKSNKFEQKET